MKFKVLALLFGAFLSLSATAGDITPERCGKFLDEFRDIEWDLAWQAYGSPEFTWKPGVDAFRQEIANDPGLVNCVDPFNQTPLMAALQSCPNLKVANLLVELGADVSMPDPVMDQTPLYYAATIHQQIWGPSPTHDSCADTRLFVYVKAADSIDFIRRLVANGADPLRVSRYHEAIPALPVPQSESPSHRESPMAFSLTKGMTLRP